MTDETPMEEKPATLSCLACKWEKSYPIDAVVTPESLTADIEEHLEHCVGIVKHVRRYMVKKMSIFAGKVGIVIGVFWGTVELVATLTN